MSKKNKPSLQNDKTKKDIRNRNILLAVLLGITFMVFSHGLNNAVLNFDDTAYLTDNPLIQNLTGENLVKIFTEPYYGGYYPLTLLSFGIDLKIAGDHVAMWAHLVNLLLHMANVLLVFLLLSRLTGLFYPAFLAAALFAIHPLHVESVAWITERKDVLYSLFFLLSVVFYTRYLEKANLQKYWLSLLFFLLSVISKTMAASLVLTLFAIDYYKGRDFRDKKLWLEKIPFLIFAVAFGIISIQAQQAGGMITADGQLTVWDKIVYASFTYLAYVGKLIFPYSLSAFYPFPEQMALYHYSGLLFVVLVIGALIKLFKKQDRAVVFGILFFTFNIVLVLQVLQINNFFMADRFTYVASIGFFLILALHLNQILNKYPQRRTTVYSIIAVYILILTVRTYKCIEVWQDSVSVWTNMIDKYPDRIPKAYYFRAYAYLEQGSSKEALHDLNKVIELKPAEYLPMAYQSRATLMANTGRFENALSDINQALELDSSNVSYLLVRGRLYLDMNRMVQAKNDFDKAVQLNPDEAVPYYYRAMYYTKVKDFKSALKDYDAMVILDPENGELYYNRAIIKYQLGQKDEACQDFRQAANQGYQRAYSMLRSYCGQY